MSQVSRLHRQTVPVAALLFALLTEPALADKKLYRWVDEQGRVQYGDKLPPEAAKQKTESLDTKGRVRSVRAREPTAAEAEAAAEAAKQQAVLEAEQARKAAYERALLMTYSSVADLQQVRDERLATLDQRLALVERSANDQEAALAEFESTVPAGKPLSKEQQKHREVMQESLAESLKSRGSLREERERTARQFTEDIQRFKELRQQGG
jgi:pyruvate/2-oxoglutarate dehydrogenase complex dihydrolipoamide acyltransferase (E2) component